MRILKLPYYLVLAAGAVLFGVSTVNFFGGYGTRWELGEYWMPKTLLSDDGTRYRDGSEIPPEALAIVRSGNEQKVYLAMLLALVVVIFVMEVRDRLKPPSKSPPFF